MTTILYEVTAQGKDAKIVHLVDEMQAKRLYMKYGLRLAHLIEELYVDEVEFDGVTETARRRVANALIL